MFTSHFSCAYSSSFGWEFQIWYSWNKSTHSLYDFFFFTVLLVMLWKSFSSQNLYVQILAANMIVLGGEGLFNLITRWAFWKGISPLIKSAQGSTFVLYSICKWSEELPYINQGWVLTSYQICNQVNFGSSTQKYEKQTFLFIRYPIYFLLAAQIGQRTYLKINFSKVKRFFFPVLCFFIE